MNKIVSFQLFFFKKKIVKNAINFHYGTWQNLAPRIRNPLRKHSKLRACPHQKNSIPFRILSPALADANGSRSTSEGASRIRFLQCWLVAVMITSPLNCWLPGIFSAVNDNNTTNNFANNKLEFHGRFVLNLPTHDDHRIQQQHQQNHHHQQQQCLITLLGQVQSSNSTPHVGFWNSSVAIYHHFRRQTTSPNHHHHQYHRNRHGQQNNRENLYENQGFHFQPPYRHNMETRYIFLKFFFLCIYEKLIWIKPNPRATSRWYARRSVLYIPLGMVAPPLGLGRDRGWSKNLSPEPLEL